MKKTYYLWEGLSDAAKKYKQLRRQEDVHFRMANYHEDQRDISKLHNRTKRAKHHSKLADKYFMQGWRSGDKGDKVAEKVPQKAIRKKYRETDAYTQPKIDREQIRMNKNAVKDKYKFRNESIFNKLVQIKEGSIGQKRVERIRNLYYKNLNNKKSHRVTSLYGVKKEAQNKDWYKNQKRRKTSVPKSTKDNRLN